VSINNTPQSLLSSPNLHPLSAHSITTQQNTTSSLPNQDGQHTNSPIPTVR